MRKQRSKAIRRLMERFDVGLLTAISKEWGKEANNMSPKRIYRSGKKLWKQHHESTPTWGLVKIDTEKLTKAIEEAKKNEELKSTVSRSAVSESDGNNLPEQV